MYPSENFRLNKVHSKTTEFKFNLNYEKFDFCINYNRL